MRVSPREIIITLNKQNGDVAKTAAILGIHKTTVYRWMKRAHTGYGTYTSRGLVRKSTRPHTIQRILSLEEQSALITLRNTYGYGPRKLKKLLNTTVSAKTIQRYLDKKGLLTKTKKYKRPRFQNTTHMHVSNTKTIGYLQMDVKHITPALSGLTWTCYEYAVMDIYSRYKEAVILNQLDQDGAISALAEILPKLPFTPVFVQTDNGLEFQTRFKEYVTNAGMEHHFIHKSAPNENAVIERSFRTDEEEFFFRLEKRPEHYDELRKWFAEYLHIYNTFRPHLGIQLQTPAQVVAHVLSP